MRIFDSGYSNDFDGPGTRLVFYLKGCNFRCDWCGAPESLSAEPQTLHYPERTVIAGRDLSPEAVRDKAVAARDFISGVTFGGGEPTLQSVELLTALALLREAGIHTALESNASTPAYREVVLAADWIFSDLKTANEQMFQTRIHPGPVRLEKVFDNLRFAAEHKPDFVLRIPVISGVNDIPEEQAALLEVCRDLQARRPYGPLQVQLLRQHHIAQPKYRALGMDYPCDGATPPPRELLEHFAALLNENKMQATLFG